MRVFVSYCHEEATETSERFVLFIEALRLQDEIKIELFIDSKHPGAAIGASIPDFTREIDRSDVAIVLLTPNYKEHVEKRHASAAAAEFRLIREKLLAAEDKGSYGRSFLVVPILLSGGGVEDSSPRDIKHLVTGDLRWLAPSQRKTTRRLAPGDSALRVYLKPRIEKSERLKFEHFLSEIVGRLQAIQTTSGTRFGEKQAAYSRQLLFSETKSQWGKQAHHAYLKATFVKTMTFLQAKEGEISVVIGRKGSGKLTLADVLPVYTKPSPIAGLRVEFDQLPFQFCFNVLRRNPSAASDLRFAFSPLYSYQLLWDAFLHLYLAWKLRSKLPVRSALRKLLDGLLAEQVKNADSDLEAHVIATKVLFVYTFEVMVKYVNALVSSDNPLSGFASAFASFTPTMFRKHVFGDTGWKQVIALLEGEQPEGQRILITADGFDTVSGYYAVNDEFAKQAAIDFEREVLLSLLLVVLNVGPGRVFGGILYDRSHFLVAIPDDRFKELKSLDRDRYRFRSKVAEISWSGIELSSLVRKRLALMRHVNDPKGESLEQRLGDVLGVGYPELPEEINLSFCGASYRMPVFLYVLRHTFWRPRDVLYFYSALLAAAEVFKTKGRAVSAAYVRQVIASSTNAVVDDEFIDEYSGTFRNISVVIQAFLERPQILGWADLDMILDPIRFDMLTPKGEDASLKWKIEVLYELGFLGVLLDARTAERLSTHRHCFSFNEGSVLTDRLGRDMYSSCKFAIHPVFVEKLHLDTSANSELILPLDWDYLHSNEIMRRSRQ